MTKEWNWKSRSGKQFFHAGVLHQDAVGAEKPSDTIPLQEGVRLFAAKGVDTIWITGLLLALLRLLTHRRRNKRKKLRRSLAQIRRMI